MADAPDDEDFTATWRDQFFKRDIPARCRMGRRAVMSFSALARERAKSRMICCRGNDAPARSPLMPCAPVGQHLIQLRRAASPVPPLRGRPNSSQV